MSDTNDTQVPANGRWHVTKGIPLSLILTIASVGVGQTVALIFWAAMITTKQQIFEDFMKATQPQTAQIAVIQEKVTTLQTAVNRLEDWLHHNVPIKNQSP
jgi:ABC-type arginine/histidine transport system permease subunit